MNKGAATVVTRLTAPSINVEFFLKAAAAAVGMAVISDGGAACEKRIFEHPLDARAEPL